MFLSWQKAIRSSATQCASTEDDSSVCHIFLRYRQADNLSVDNSRSSQSFSLLLSIILGSAMKTTSIQVTEKTMKTILRAHRVQRRSCPSSKAVIRINSSLYAVEHNAVDKNTANGDLGDFRSPFRAALPFMCFETDNIATPMYSSHFKSYPLTACSMLVTYPTQPTHFRA